MAWLVKGVPLPFIPFSFKKCCPDGYLKLWREKRGFTLNNHPMRRQTARLLKLGADF
jgi:hypothetical protein